MCSLPNMNFMCCSISEHAKQKDKSASHSNQSAPCPNGDAQRKKNIIFEPERRNPVESSKHKIFFFLHFSVQQIQKNKRNEKKGKANKKNKSAKQFSSVSRFKLYAFVFFIFSDLCSAFLWLSTLKEIIKGKK